MFRFTLYSPGLNRQIVLPPDAVDGWDESAFEKLESARYFGLNYKFSTNLTFIKEGLDFVASVYELEGVSANCLIRIDLYNINTYQWKKIFLGRLDFKDYDIGSEEVSLEVEPIGFEYKFAARDEQTINLQKLQTMDGAVINPYTNEIQIIPLHSKILKKEYKGEKKADSNEVDGPYYESGSSKMISYGFLGFDTVEKEINVVGFNIDSIIETFPENIKLYVFEAEEAGTYQFDYSFKFQAGLKKDTSQQFTTNVDISMWMVIRKSDGGRSETVLDSYTGPYSAHTFDLSLSMYTIISNVITWTGTQNRILEVGDEVYIYLEIEDKSTTPLTNNTVHFLKHLENSTIDVIGDTTYPSTNCNMVMVHEAFSRLAEAITGYKNSFYSELFGRTDSEPVTYELDGALSMYAITNGFQIRGFLLAEKPIFATFWDLYQTMNAINPLGMIIDKNEYGEPRLRIESRIKIIELSAKLSINFMPDLKKKVASDLYFNKVEIGYADWENETINNLDEFCTRHEYSTLFETKNSMKIISPYIASGYSIEFLRRESDKPTKDQPNDNKNFIINVKRDGSGGFEPEKNGTFTTVNNLIDPASAYNLNISPKRNLLRWAPILGTSFYKRTSKMAFQFAEGNYSLETQKSTEANLLIEGSDVENDKFTRPFLPELYNFEAKVELPEIFELIERTANIIFEFRSGNFYKYGLVKRIKVIPYRMELTAELYRIDREIAAELIKEELNQFPYIFPITLD